MVLIQLCPLDYRCPTEPRGHIIYYVIHPDHCRTYQASRPQFSLPFRISPLLGTDLTTVFPTSCLLEHYHRRGQFSVDIRRALLLRERSSKLIV